MKKYLIIGFSAMFISAGFCADNWQTIKKEFPADKVSALDILTDSGDIKITALPNSKKIEIEIVRYNEDKCNFDAGVNGSTFSAELKQAKRFRFFDRGCEANIKITAPSAALRLSSGSGDITASGFKSGADIKTGSGDITAMAIDGGLSAKTASGDIKLAKVSGKIKAQAASGDISGFVDSGDTDINTASGNADIAGLKGNFYFSGASGSVRAVWTKPMTQGKAVAKTASGDVELSFPSDSKIVCDISTASGDIYDKACDETDDGFEIAAKTASGDIDINKI